MLRAVLAFGVKSGWIEKAPHIERPRADPSRQRWLTHEEADLLLDACVANHVKLFVNLGIKTGARVGAILELTWDRVSFDKDIIFYPIPGKNHGKKRRAIVPISPDLRKELKVAQEFAQTDWVIEYNGKPIKSVSEGFNTARKRAGIDHCTIHDLRHTCATWQIAKGISTTKVARMLGDTERMIEKVYGHHAPDYLKEAANALDW